MRCGAYSSGVCLPERDVHQLIEDAVPGSVVCLDLSNVIFVREGEVETNS